jgi:mannose-6-phosphate isomerase-like protein (cupin superfamily)
MITKRFLLLTLIEAGAAVSALAQFTGRPGDVVLWALTPRNAKMEFLAVPTGTTNSAQLSARFEVIDINTKPLLPIPPGTLPPGVGLAFRRQLLHEEPDDEVYLVSREELGDFPHRIYLTTNKTLVIEGILREQEAHIDAAASLYVTLAKGTDFGGDIPLVPLKVLFWTPSSDFPAVDIQPPGVTGPAVPPGLKGYEYNLASTKFAQFTPWVALRRLYPAGGWQDGIDAKLIEQDTVAGNTTQYIRLRPGRRTPTFRMPASTHLFVLQGSVNITADSRTTMMKKNDYAFVPGGFVLSLSNPNPYTGPQPKAAANAQFATSER